MTTPGAYNRRGKHFPVDDRDADRRAQADTESTARAMVASGAPLRRPSAPLPPQRESNHFTQHVGNLETTSRPLPEDALNIYMVAYWAFKTTQPADCHPATELARQDNRASPHSYLADTYDRPQNSLTATYRGFLRKRATPDRVDLAPGDVPAFGAERRGARYDFIGDARQIRDARQEARRTRRN